MSGIDDCKLYCLHTWMSFGISVYNKAITSPWMNKFIHGSLTYLANNCILLHNSSVSDSSSQLISSYSFIHLFIYSFIHPGYPGHPVIDLSIYPQVEYTLQLNLEGRIYSASAHTKKAAKTLCASEAWDFVRQTLGQ